MRRRRFFKLKLTKKQKGNLLGFLIFLLAVAGGLLLYQHHAKFWIHRFAPQMGKPKIVFVIDDIGGHDRLTTELLNLKDQVTYAILPLLPYSKYFAHLSEKTKAEVILHLPLDTVNDVIPGPGLIVDTMPDEDVRELLARNLDSVPRRVGVNNHCGSRGTTDKRLMRLILTELKKRGLFFLDSYTTRESVVREVAHKVGVKVLTRGVFLDNSDAKSAISKEIQHVKTLARQKGSAIAIGHYRKNTLEVLAREIPRLKKNGFEIISLKDLLKIRSD